MPCMSCTLRGLLEFGTCYWLRKISNHALVGWPHCDRYFAHCFGTTLSAWYQNHTGGTLCELPRQTVVYNEDPWRIKKVISPIWGSERGAIRIGWSIGGKTNTEDFNPFRGEHGPREGRNHPKICLISSDFCFRKREDFFREETGNHWFWGSQNFANIAYDT